MTERIDLDKDGVDDVAISGVEMFRLERMDKGSFWCACYVGNARHVFWIRAEKGKVVVRHDREAMSPTRRIESKDVVPR